MTKQSRGRKGFICLVTGTAESGGITLSEDVKMGEGILKADRNPSVG